MAETAWLSSWPKQPGCLHGRDGLVTFLTAYDKFIRMIHQRPSNENLNNIRFPSPLPIFQSSFFWIIPCILNLK